MANYTSAKINHTAVEEQIRAEIQEGRYVKVSNKPLLVSALGAIPKSDGSVRLIHDCSRPRGQALNDYATEPFHIKYQTLNAALDYIKPNSYLAKVDLKSAYRSVGLHPSNFQYTGLKWKFTGDTDYTYFYDRALPFGARKSPGIFHRLTQAVRRMMKRRGFVVIAYLDDFLIIADNRQQCLDALNTLISLLRELGFSIAWGKTEGPKQALVFLGVLVDTQSMTLHLPQEKVTKLLQLLTTFSQRSRASRRQLQQLVGKLSWASHVVHGGRIYLQRVLDRLRPLQLTHHKAKLDTEFQADIQWWIQCLKIFNKKSLLPKDTSTIPIFTDACKDGAGMLCPFDWAYVDWPLDVPALSKEHINVKETMAVILAIYRWAPQLCNSQVHVYTDNVTTRANINRGACRNPRLMSHLRSLFWLSVVFNFEIKCFHVAGTDNIYADSISRLRDHGHRLHWLSVCSKGAPPLPGLLYHQFVNHMSPNSCALLLQHQNSYNN